MGFKITLRPIFQICKKASTNSVECTCSITLNILYCHALYSALLSLCGCNSIMSHLYRGTSNCEQTVTGTGHIIIICDHSVRLPSFNERPNDEAITVTPATLLLASMMKSTVCPNEKCSPCTTNLNASYFRNANIHKRGFLSKPSLVTLLLCYLAKGS